MIVDLEVYNAAGAKIGQTYLREAKLFGGPETRNTTRKFHLPTTATAGKYTFKLGVFTAGWISDVYWDNAAASFTLSTTGEPPPRASAAQSTANR